MSHDRVEGYFAAGDVTRHSPFLLALVSKFVDFYAFTRSSSVSEKQHENGQQRERKGSGGLSGGGRKESKIVSVVFRSDVWVSISVS